MSKRTIKMYLNSKALRSKFGQVGDQPVSVPADEAVHYLNTGLGRPAKGVKIETATGKGAAENTALGYGSKSKADLVALAETRGLTVTRADGQDGDPVKADYVAALEAADSAASGQPGDEEEE